MACLWAWSPQHSPQCLRFTSYRASLGYIAFTFLAGFHLRLWSVKWSGVGNTPGIQYLVWQRFKPGFVHKRSKMNIRGDLKFSKCKGKSKQVGWLMHWFAEESPNCYHLHEQQQFHWMCPATRTQKSRSTGPHHVYPEPDLSLFLISHVLALNSMML